jgi:hypothetical protein
MAALILRDPPAVEEQERRRNKTKKISGFNSTPRSATADNPAPSRIWTRGTGIGRGDILAASR